MNQSVSSKGMLNSDIGCKLDVLFIYRHKLILSIKTEDIIIKRRIPVRFSFGKVMAGLTVE